GFDAVVVPFIFPLGPIFAWDGAFPAERMRAVGFAGGAGHAEDIAMAGGGRFARLLVGPLEIDKHLHLHSAREPAADARQPIGADEEPGIAFRALLGRNMHPLELGDEVLILLVGPQIPIGLPVVMIMSSLTKKVPGAQLTLTQPPRSLPLNNGLNPSSWAR